MVIPATAKRNRRINKTLVAVILLFTCIGFISAVPYSCKQQRSIKSIVDPYPSLINEGTVQTIQVDSQGRLYIWLDSNRLMRMDEATGKKDWFLYGYASSSPSRFRIRNDQIQFQDSGGIKVYSLGGDYVTELEASAPFQSIRSVTYKEVEYTVRKRGLMETVWKNALGKEQPVYRRISYSSGMPIFISAVVVTACVLALKRSNGIKGSLIMWAIDPGRYRAHPCRPSPDKAWRGYHQGAIRNKCTKETDSIG